MNVMIIKHKISELIDLQKKYEDFQKYFFKQQLKKCQVFNINFGESLIQAIHENFNMFQLYKYSIWSDIFNCLI